MTSIMGTIMRDVARKRKADFAERLLDRIVAGRDTTTMRQRAEHWCREAATHGHPDDQFRLAAILFNRIAVESMDAAELAPRVGEALMLLDTLIEQDYGPAAELRPYLLEWAPLSITVPVTGGGIARAQ